MIKTRNRIVEALEDPAFDWRSIHGVVESTGIVEPVVIGVVDEMKRNGELICVADPANYRVLITTRNHYRNVTSCTTREISMLTNRIS